MDKLSILIVEDTPADILLIKDMLAENRKLSWELTEAATLRGAIALLSRAEFDAVLLDLYLPDSEGIDTVRRVISQFPESAVVVLASLKNEQTAFQAIRYGAQDFLEKQDLSPVMLLKSVLYAIERKRFLQEKENLLEDLALALKKIESLETILPICLCCKKILDNKQWLGIEEYLSNHPAVELACRICPECAKDLENTQ
jgi:DNA-binding NarL/FixJ family response regulator